MSIMNKSPEERRLEKEKRMMDAINLRIPDRVPINVHQSFFPAYYAGITCREAMYDPDKTAEASLKFHQEFEPDEGENPFRLLYIGKMLETIGYKNLVWPGHGVSDDLPYQFLETELISQDEYDEIINNPTDFVFRKIWPRAFSTLEPFQNMPYFDDVVAYLGGPMKFMFFADPEVQKALEAMAEAGKCAQEIIQRSLEFETKAKELGISFIQGGAALAPFDYISDFLRGTKGSMIDMFRAPEKLLTLTEKVLPCILRDAVMSSKMTGKPMVFIPLHKGLDSFMSPDQFKTFYWPTLKKLCEALIAEDLIPQLFWEGNVTSRLEIIKDLPPGKAIFKFEATDIFKAKEVLGDRFCIEGNVPLSILITGTPDDVKDYCKKLIDIVGKGGGYIMSASTDLSNAKPENVKAMFEFTKEYGVY